MVRGRAASNEHVDTDSPGPRPGGRPRDAALDEAIILATRDRLVRDGYSQMTIGDIAADANVSRPTLYRRWSTKFELVVDALDYGFRKERDTYTPDLSRMEPREALVEAVRRLDPAYFTPDAMVLMGNFASEAVHTPELLEILRKQAVEPRVTLVENVLSQLQERGAVRDDIDKHTIATMCFGGYFAAFYRGENTKELPETVVAALWPSIVKATDAERRTSATVERTR
jgi:AcrR family transcriptional regulator